MNRASPVVEVHSLPGCPHLEETLSMAGAVLFSMLPGAALRDLRLTEAEAAQRGFPGSPTVLVDGRDIAGKQPHAAGVS